ncbi:MAG: hypothetical protein M1453_02850 [Acidobacteria bacterium]|nr:hypothetical protein [Acidobacteriota bacterium]MCL5286919.1 hypothetical protein [Acidobacteriota bacterium]
MKTYRFTPEAIDKLNRRFARGIPITIGLGAISSLFVAKLQFDWFVVILPLIVSILLIPFIPKFLRKHQDEVWGAYELVLKDDSLLQKQKGMSDIEISRGEITSLGRGPGGELIVRTASRYKKIIIPKELDGFEELKMILERWQPLEAATSQRLEQLVTSVGTFAFLAVHYARDWIKDQRYLVLADLAFAIAMLWICIETQRNPYVDARTKRWTWLVVFPVAFAVYDALQRWGVRWSLP